MPNRNMEQQINIAELLKDCPKGTKLYSPICGECELDKVERVNYGGGYRVETQIKIHCNGESPLIFFKQNGCVEHGGECLLFPSKEVRDWGMFRVKYAWGGDGITDGDKVKKLLMDNGGINSKHAFYKCSNPTYIYYIDAITHEINASTITYDKDYILSTGTELKLEEEQPKFKVGDVVKDDEDSCAVVTEHEVKGEVFISMQDASNPNCGIVGIATPEEIAKWNENVLHPNHLHYSKSKRKIIDWFLPFDKVVVRGSNSKVWLSRQFDYYLKKCGYLCQDAGLYEECLPYNEETARLIGTANDCKGEE